MFFLKRLLPYVAMAALAVGGWYWVKAWIQAPLKQELKEEQEARTEDRRLFSEALEAEKEQSKTLRKNANAAKKLAKKNEQALIKMMDQMQALAEFQLELPDQIDAVAEAEAFNRWRQQSHQKWLDRASREN